MPEHMPGLDLSGRFYREAVRPILERDFPGLAHSAALLGPGSEVLGFDTARSRDHHWGLRLILFLDPKEYAQRAGAIHEALRQELPVRFLGFSTNFTQPDPNDNGVRHPQPVEKGPVDHMVGITTPADYGRQELGVDPFVEFSALDWLTIEEQRLLSLTRGRVFHDGLGQLEGMRRKLAYYPRDVWLYLMAAEWQKIGQEEAFVGRTGEVGDDLGSRLVAARLVHSLMRLGFMMERQYAPYSKWFGTAFARLDCAHRLTSPFEGALAASTWKERESYLCQAYEVVAGMHNALGVTPAVPEQPTLYFGRPFLVIHGDAIAARLREAIQDEEIRRLPLIGSVSQYLSSVDVLDEVHLCQKLRPLYG